MDIIKIENVKKQFKQGENVVEALRGVSFSIQEAEFAALVEPSGSGKTTLLNIIGGLDSLTEGKVEVDSEDLSTMKNKQLSEFRLNKVGFVFQAYNLIPVLTVLENVEYVLMLQGKKPKERKEISQKLLHEMGLSELENRFPRQISGGQQQRVAVCRALVSDPAVVLADEPTANLDGKNAELLLDIMQEMCEKKKRTFLFSTR